MCGYGLQRKQKKKKAKKKKVSGTLSLGSDDNDNDSESDNDDPGDNEEGDSSDLPAQIKKRSQKIKKKKKRQGQEVKRSTKETNSEETKVKNRKQKQKQGQGLLLATTPPTSSESSLSSTQRIQGRAKTPSSGSSNESINLNFQLPAVAVAPGPTPTTASTSAVATVNNNNRSTPSNVSSGVFNPVSPPASVLVPLPVPAQVPVQNPTGGQIPFSSDKNSPITSGLVEDEAKSDSVTVTKSTTSGSSKSLGQTKKKNKKKPKKVTDKKKREKSPKGSKVKDKDKEKGSKVKSKSKSSAAKSKSEDSQVKDSLQSDPNVNQEKQDKGQSRVKVKGQRSRKESSASTGSSNERSSPTGFQRQNYAAIRYGSGQDNFGRTFHHPAVQNAQFGVDPRVDPAIKSRQLIYENIESKRFSMNNPQFNLFQETSDGVAPGSSPARQRMQYSHPVYKVAPVTISGNNNNNPGFPVKSPGNKNGAGVIAGENWSKFGSGGPSPTRFQGQGHGHSINSIKAKDQLYSLIPDSFKKKKNPGEELGAGKTGSRFQQGKVSKKKLIESQEFTVVTSPSYPDVVHPQGQNQGQGQIQGHPLISVTPMSQVPHNKSNKASIKEPDSSPSPSSLSDRSTRLITPGQSSAGSSVISAISKTPINRNQIQGRGGNKGSKFKFRGYSIKLDWANAQLRKSVIQLFVNPKASEFHFADRRDSGSVTTGVSTLLKFSKKLRAKFRSKPKPGQGGRGGGVKPKSRSKSRRKMDEIMQNGQQGQQPQKPGYYDRKGKFREVQSKVEQQKHKPDPESAPGVKPNPNLKQGQQIPEPVDDSEDGETKTDITIVNFPAEEFAADVATETEKSSSEAQVTEKVRAQVKPGKLTKMYQLNQVAPDLNRRQKSDRSGDKDKEAKRSRNETHEVTSFDLKPSEIFNDDQQYKGNDNDHEEEGEPSDPESEARQENSKMTRKKRSKKKERVEATDDLSEDQSSDRDRDPGPSPNDISRSLAKWKKKREEKDAKGRSSKKERNNPTDGVPDFLAPPPDLGVIWAEAILLAQKKYQEQQQQHQQQNSTSGSASTNNRRTRKQKRANRLQRLFSASGKAEKFPPMKEKDPKMIRFPRALVGDSSSSNSVLVEGSKGHGNGNKNADGEEDLLNDPKFLAAAAESAAWSKLRKLRKKVQKDQLEASLELFQPIKHMPRKKNPGSIRSAKLKNKQQQQPKNPPSGGRK